MLIHRCRKVGDAACTTAVGGDPRSNPRRASTTGGDPCNKTPSKLRQWEGAHAATPHVRQRWGGGHAATPRAHQWWEGTHTTTPTSTPRVGGDPRSNPAHASTVGGGPRSNPKYTLYQCRPGAALREIASLCFAFTGGRPTQELAWAPTQARARESWWGGGVKSV